MIVLLAALAGSVAQGATAGMYGLPAGLESKAGAKPVAGERYLDLDAFGAAAAKVMPAAVTRSHAAVRELRWRLPKNHTYGPQDPRFRPPNMPDDIYFQLVAGSASLKYMLWVGPKLRAGRLAGATSVAPMPVLVNGKFLVPVNFVKYDLDCALEAKVAVCPTATGKVRIPVNVRTF